MQARMSACVREKAVQADESVADRNDRAETTLLDAALTCPSKACRARPLAENVGLW
jgi:hypothetical protein